MYIIQAPLLKLKKYASLNFSNYRNIYVTIFCFKKKYLCACVYNIYIHIYLYTYNLCFPVECIFMRFLTRTKTNRHSISILLITYKFLNNTKSCSTCSLIGKKGACGRVCMYTPWAVTSHRCGEGLPLVNLLTHLDLLSVGFQFAPLARNTDGSLSASPISSWIFFFFFKQLFETTTGILSIISWKFVVVCLKYN